MRDVKKLRKIQIQVLETKFFAKCFFVKARKLTLENIKKTRTQEKWPPSRF